MEERLPIAGSIEPCVCAGDLRAVAAGGRPTFDFQIVGTAVADGARKDSVTAWKASANGPAASRTPENVGIWRQCGVPRGTAGATRTMGGTNRTGDSIENRSWSVVGNSRKWSDRLARRRWL